MSPRLLAIIPLAVGINLALGQLAAVTSLPLFLDTVGTVMVACLAGVGTALGTGLVSQVAFAAVTGNGTWLAFMPVQLAVALYASYAARAAWFATTPRALAAGLGLGIVAATMSWPISYFAFGGVTAGGVTAVTALLNGMGIGLEWSVYLASLYNDLLDKSVTFLLVRSLLVSLPRRMSGRYPRSAQALGRI